MALTHLQILAKRYPNVAAVLAELANLEAVLTLPTPTVHVVSDVHGEDVKLRQVINNASGSLRPLFERLFAGCWLPGCPAPRSSSCSRWSTTRARPGRRSQVSSRPITEASSCTGSPATPWS